MLIGAYAGSVHVEADVPPLPTPIAWYQCDTLVNDALPDTINPVLNDLPVVGGGASPVVVEFAPNLIVDNYTGTLTHSIETTNTDDGHFHKELAVPLSLSSSEFTVSMWFYATTNIPSGSIIGLFNASSQPIVHVLWLNNTLMWMTYSGGYSATDFWPADKWHHLVITRDATGITRLYRNDMHLETRAEVAMPNTTTLHTITLLAYTGSWHFRKNIFDLRIFSSALSAMQVRQLLQS